MWFKNNALQRIGNFLNLFLHQVVVALSLFSAVTAYGQELDNISARSWIIASNSGDVISGKNTTEVRSIASITKLMTALVVIDANQTLNEIISQKFYNQPVTRRQLLELMVVKSDNQAAQKLCEFYPTGLKGCIQAMNDKAIELKMTNTRFTDPTGLQHTNVSTAEDLLKLVHAASNYDLLNEDSNKRTVTWKIKKNRIIFKNTNPMAGKIKMKVSKTGWINKAGGCIALMVESSVGSKIVIVLGSTSTITRIADANIILAHKSF